MCFESKIQAIVLNQVRIHVTTGTNMLDSSKFSNFLFTLIIIVVYLDLKGLSYVSTLLN